MPLIRPIGHIAGSLSILAISVAYRLRLAADGTRYLCWVDDDGCVYLALTHHTRAVAVRRYFADNIVRTYGKPKRAAFPLSTSDLINDLQEARSAQAARHLRDAHTEALSA